MWGFSGLVEDLLASQEGFLELAQDRDRLWVLVFGFHKM
jgi:hypothetical protein